MISLESSTTSAHSPLITSASLNSFAISINQTEVLEIVVALVFAVWLTYTIVVVYHWVRYGNRSQVGVPAVLLHFVVSGALFLFAVSGFVPTL